MPSISLNGCIAVDMGSSTTYVATDDSSKTVSFASCALIDARRSEDVYAVGDQAKRFDGRTGDNALLVSPISYGSVADSELAALLLLYACENCGSKKRSIEKSRLLLITPQGSTKVERGALARSAEIAGAKHLTILRAPVAAAVGLKAHIEKAEAKLVVSIGYGVTEISVISAGAVVLSRHIKTGSSAFDRAIIRYVRRESGLLISASSAEEIKRQMGSATPLSEDTFRTLSGKNVRSGRPVTASLSTTQITQAIEAPIQEIVDEICDALYNIPTEFATDIYKSGIYLTGGGSTLFDLNKRLTEETNLPVIQSEDPRFDTVKGAAALFSEDKLMRLCLSAQSAFEV